MNVKNTNVAVMSMLSAVASAKSRLTLQEAAPPLTPFFDDVLHTANSECSEGVQVSTYSYYNSRAA